MSSAPLEVLPAAVGRSVFSTLTVREHEAALLARGAPGAEQCAEAMDCSVKTFDTHRNRVMKKLFGEVKAGNNVRLLLLALRCGVVAPPAVDPGALEAAPADAPPV